MRSILTIIFWIIVIQGFAQPLSGTYTIGGSSPDYPKMSDAVQALDSLGINGPVTFNIRNGTYTDYIVIDTIAGTSDTSWVIFQSETGDSSAVVIAGYSGSLSMDRVLGFGAGAQYIRIKKLTFMEPDPNQRAITSFDSHHLEFYNCVFTGPTTTVHQQPLVSMGLDSNLVIQNCLFTGSVRDLSIGDIYTRKNIFIRSCNFHGGLESLRLHDLKNVEVLNCNFYGTYGGVGIKRSILIDEIMNLKMMNNFIDASGNTSSRGYALEVRTSTFQTSYFINNVILAASNFTIGSAAILFGNAQGVFRNDIFAYNTIRFSSPNPSNPVFSSPNCALSGTNMYNNIIVNESSGYIYDNCSYPTDYNLLYTTGAISPQYSNFAQLQQAGLDSHSVFAPPLFDSIRPGLSHAPEIDSAGFPFSIVTKDFIGNFRDPNFPDIGPYELINPPVVRFPLDTNVCESVILDAGNPGSSFLWSTGDTTQAILVDSTASYWVTASNSKGSNTDTIQVYVDSLNLPQYQLQASFDSLCTGGCAVLSTNLDSNLFQLTWSNNSGIIGSGSIVNVCPVSFPQKYLLQITDGGTCVRTDSLIIFERTVPPVVNTLSDTTICYGDSLLLTTTSSDSIQGIVWQNNGQNIGSGAVWVKPDSTTTYTAVVDFVNGCTATTSTEIGVNYILQPAVSLAFDTLLVNDEWVSYQWFVNGNSIPAAIDTFWVAQQNGNYSVLVTDSLGCAAESNPLSFNSFDLREFDQQMVKLYPNPVEYNLTIETNSRVTNPRFELYNLVGQKMTIVVTSVRKHLYDMDVESLKPGLYFIKIQFDGNIVIREFIKN